MRSLLLSDRLPPFIVLGIILGVWWAVTEFGSISSLLLPTPLSVVAQLSNNIATGMIFEHLAYSLTNILVGFALGSAFAFCMGVLVAKSRIAELFLLVHLTAFQSIPKVAIAPLFFVWLGFGAESSIALVALVCFFPVFTNTLVGLRSADPNLVMLYRQLGATPFRLFRRVELPASLPNLMTGLQIAIIFSLLASVVMEFITGNRGLGFLIENSSQTWNTAQVFAALLVLAVLGVSFTAILRFLRRRIVFWQREGEQAVMAEA